MSNKNFRSTKNKRAIDVGKVTTPTENDLIKFWRTDEGDEKAISLLDLAVGISPDVPAPPNEDTILTSGSIVFNTNTNIDIIADPLTYTWRYDEVVQDGGEELGKTIPDSPTTYNRIDALAGDNASNYYWIEGDENENVVLEPTIPSNRVVLEYILRTPAGDNTPIPVIPDLGIYVDKITTGTQTIVSNLAITPQATSEAFRRSVYFDANGVPRSIRVDYHGVYSTLSGSSNWSRLIRTDATINNQLDYRLIFDLVGVNSQKGQVWIEFTLDGSGDMVSNNLQLFGDFTDTRFRMVKIASYIYDIFVQHTETADSFKWRPQFSFGASDKYTYFHQESLGALPAGDQYSFSLFGGGGGVQSVTGDGVDNTDPDNPVISLAGIAISGSPYDLDQEGASDGDVLTWVTANSRYEPVTPSGGADTNTVHYNADDGKNATEKLRARDNIGLDSGIATVITSTSTAFRNNIARPTNVLVYQTALATMPITGFVAGNHGEKLFLYVNTANANWGLQLTHESTSTAENRLNLPDGVSFKITQYKFVTFIYDGYTQRWNLAYIQNNIPNIFTDKVTFKTSGVSSPIQVINDSATVAVERFGVYYNTSTKIISALGTGFEVGVTLKAESGIESTGLTRSGFTHNGLASGQGALWCKTLNTGNAFSCQDSSDNLIFQVTNTGDLGLFEGGNFVLGTSTGTKIGTATSQKLSFWNKTPIIQPTTGIAAATFTANTSGIANDTATFGGYTIGQIAQALINVGLLA